MNMNFINQLTGTPSPILVIGAGRSGIAATKLLLKHNINVTLFDDHDQSKLRFLNASGLIESDSLSFAFGRPPDLSADFRAVILSPGISPDHFLIAWAKERGVPVLSEIDLGFMFMPPTMVIGITGTNGKSTTTVMMESIMNAAGFRAIACGNLGRPLCDVLIDDALDINCIVLELSSFQLESSFYLRLDGALIINITPDHLDRHANFKDYQSAKLKIASLLNDNGCVVANDDLRHELAHDKRASFFSAHTYGHGDYSFLADTKIKGLHNHENAMAASVLAQRLGVKDCAILKGLMSFTPLPHRCEVIGQKNGVLFINDSKGTTVEAVKKALSTFEMPTHLLLGGIAKGEDFALLNASDFPHIKRYYVYGRDQGKIMADLKSSAAESYIDLPQALEAALKNAHDGDAILLSPGCASYDQFDDYQHRGETFRNLARASWINLCEL